MIELPESHTLARQIERTLRGRTVRRAEAGHSPHGFAFYSGDPADYADRLRGRAITGAAPRGGLVEVRLEGGLLLAFNDGVAPACTLPEKRRRPSTSCCWSSTTAAT